MRRAFTFAQNEINYQKMIKFNSSSHQQSKKKLEGINLFNISL